MSSLPGSDAAQPQDLIFLFSKEEKCVDLSLASQKSIGILVDIRMDLALLIVCWCGLDSSVGIATGYGLDGPGIESRRARFSAPVQTGPGAHPASCTMGTGFFPGLKSGWGVTLTPSAVVMKE